MVDDTAIKLRQDGPTPSVVGMRQAARLLYRDIRNIPSATATRHVVVRNSVAVGVETEREVPYNWRQALILRLWWRAIDVCE